MYVDHKGPVFFNLFQFTKFMLKKIVDLKKIATHTNTFLLQISNCSSNLPTLQDQKIKRRNKRRVVHK